MIGAAATPQVYTTSPQLTVAKTVLLPIKPSKAAARDRKVVAKLDRIVAENDRKGTWKSFDQVCAEAGM
jgi:hypothetical protein